MGGPNYRFLASPPCGPAGWLALILIKAGDVETTPGPTTTHKQVWIFDICHKQLRVRKPISIRCSRIEHWVNLRTIYRYLDLPSTQRVQTHNSHMHNTTPPHIKTLVLAPLPTPHLHHPHHRTTIQDKYPGKNMLGKLLTDIRSKLRANDIKSDETTPAWHGTYVVVPSHYDKHTTWLLTATKPTNIYKLLRPQCPPTYTLPI